MSRLYLISLARLILGQERTMERSSFMGSDLLIERLAVRHASDSDNSNFMTRSPDKPFNVV